MSNETVVYEWYQNDTSSSLTSSYHSVCVFFSTTISGVALCSPKLQRLLLKCCTMALSLCVMSLLCVYACEVCIYVSFVCFRVKMPFHHVRAGLLYTDNFLTHSLSEISEEQLAHISTEELDGERVCLYVCDSVCQHSHPKLLIFYSINHSIFTVLQKLPDFILYCWAVNIVEHYVSNCHILFPHTFSYY